MKKSLLRIVRGSKTTKLRTTNTTGTDKSQQVAGEAKERLQANVLPIYSFPLKWTANPAVQEVLSQCDDLLNFRETSLRHIIDPTGKFYHPIAHNCHSFPTRQQIYWTQTSLGWNEFVDAIQDLLDITKNQEWKQHELLNTLAQLHLDYIRERQGLTL